MKILIFINHFIVIALLTGYSSNNGESYVYNWVNMADQKQ